jgi:hypothetical protein
MRLCAKCGGYAVTGSDLCRAHGGDEGDHMRERDELAGELAETRAKLDAQYQAFEKWKKDYFRELAGAREALKKIADSRFTLGSYGHDEYLIGIAKEALTTPGERVKDKPTNWEPSAVDEGDMTP